MVNIIVDTKPTNVRLFPALLSTLLFSHDNSLFCCSLKLLLKPNSSVEDRLGYFMLLIGA